MDIVWTEETLSRLFELGPEVFTPGSKMPLQKMSDPAEREALIAFLKAATAARDAPAHPSIDERGTLKSESLHKGEEP